MFWKKNKQPNAIGDQQTKELPELSRPSTDVVDPAAHEEAAAGADEAGSPANSGTLGRQRRLKKSERSARRSRGHEEVESTSPNVATVSKPMSYLAGIINPPDPAPGLAYAGVWRRYVAFLIDFPLSLMFAIAVELMCQALLPRSLFSWGFTTVILLFVAQFAYFILFEGSNWKATPGKRLLKLRVTDKRGQRITRLRAMVRLIVGLPFALIFATFFLIAFNRKRQSIADRITSTLVVRKTTESFLPKAARSFEYPFVILMAVMLTYGALATISKVVVPIIDRVTLRILSEGSLKFMMPAQKSLEEFVAKNKSLPSQLDASVVGYAKKHGVAHTIAYNQTSGAITMWFMNTALHGQGISLIPTIEKGSNKIVWRCAGVNMDEITTPASCAPSRR